jgi:hypothetical protein
MFALAGMATLYCGVAVLFSKYGKSVRLRSKFAQQSLDLVEVGRSDLECSASMAITHGGGSKGLQ